MVTDNTKRKIKQVLQDIKDDCDEGFTGIYKLHFNKGGLTEVQKTSRKDYGRCDNEN